MIRGNCQPGVHPIPHSFFPPQLAFLPNFEYNQRQPLNIFSLLTLVFEKPSFKAAEYGEKKPNEYY